MKRDTKKIKRMNNLAKKRKHQLSKTAVYNISQEYRRCHG